MEMAAAAKVMVVAAMAMEAGAMAMAAAVMAAVERVEEVVEEAEVVRLMGASPAVVPMGLPVLHAHAPVLSPPVLVTATELGLADPALPLEAMDWRRLAQAYERAETLAETRGVLDRT